MAPIRYVCIVEVMRSVRGANRDGDVSTEWRERGGPSLSVRVEQDGPMVPDRYVGLSKIVRRGRKAAALSHAELFCTVPIPIKGSRPREPP